MKLTKIEGVSVYVNKDNITHFSEEYMYDEDMTIIFLVSGKELLVKETPEKILEMLK